MSNRHLALLDNTLPILLHAAVRLGWCRSIAVYNCWDIYCFPHPDVVEGVNSPDLSRYLDFISRDTRVCARVTWAENHLVQASIKKSQKNCGMQDALFRSSSPCP